MTLTLRIAAAFIAFFTSGSACARCPSTHLQPTARYGSAFGQPEKVTTAIDLGPRSENEEAVLQYFEYQSRDPGYQPVFAVHVLVDSQSANTRVVFARLKNGKPALLEASLDRKTVDMIVAIAAPIVRDTHYRAVPCSAFYTDGHVIQVGVDWRGGEDADFIAGEAFVPIPGSPADNLRVLGRALRDIAANKMAEKELERYLREKGIARTDPPPA